MYTAQAALPQQEKRKACMCIDVTKYILKMVKLYTSPKFIADTVIHMCKQCDFFQIWLTYTICVSKSKTF
jgi:hypothetical protein